MFIVGGTVFLLTGCPIKSEQKTISLYFILFFYWISLRVLSAGLGVENLIELQPYEIDEQN